MPRDPNNNPTDRIIRMITEWVHIKDWIREVEHFMRDIDLEFEPAPPADALNEEVARQSITKVQTESQREWRRRYRRMEERKRISQTRELGRQHGLDVQSRRGLIGGMANQLRREGERIPEEPDRKVYLNKESRSIQDDALADIRAREQRVALQEVLLQIGKMPVPQGPISSPLFQPSSHPEQKPLTPEEVAEKLAIQEAALREQEKRGG